MHISRLLSFLAAFLLSAGAARADGLIVVAETGIAPRDHYAFAPLEVRRHAVDVRITDQVAITSVDQTFYNPSAQRLEGTYLFPIPEGGQIDKFTMEINGQPVQAELVEAGKARQIYEDIVRKTRDPALLEYAGRSLFKVRIFPLEPRSEKRVALKYTQVLKSDNGLVSYVYPLNTEKFSARPIENVSVKAEIATKNALKSIHSPSHPVEIKRDGERRAVVGFEAKAVKPDTDFQLLFSAAREDAEVAVNLLTYCEGSSEPGYFMLLASPGELRDPKRVMKKDVVFAFDTSASMAGEKLDQAKKALRFCLGNLDEGDRFEIVRFSTEAEPLFGAMTDATRGNVDKARGFVDGLKAAGGTAIEEALVKSIDTIRTPAPPTRSGPPAQGDRPRVVIFLTDGQPTVGNTDEGDIMKRVEASLGTASVRVFCFGVGNDVNTHLLDRVAERTKAASQYVLPSEDLEIKVSNFYARIAQPVLVNPALSVGEKVRLTKTYPAALPDLFRGDQLVLFGRYTGDGPTTLRLEGTVGGERKAFTTEVAFAEKATEHEFIPRLWATRRIGYLLDEVRLRGESKELRDEVVELARRYGVVTPYTSYLIVEEEARRSVPVALRTAAGPTPAAASTSGGAPGSLSEAGAAGSGGVSAEEYRRFREAKTGAEAVRDAQAIDALKRGENAAAADAGPYRARTAGAPVSRGDVSGGSAGPEANAPISGAAQAGRSGQAASSSGGPAASAPADSEAQAAPATRVVRGKTFYRNGGVWVDALVQSRGDAKRVEIRFNSEAYFQLVRDHPETKAWLALGTRVKFILGDTLYEIVE